MIAAPPASVDQDAELLRTLFGAHSVLRVSLVVYAVVCAVVAVVCGDQPVPVWTCVAVMGVWSALTIARYQVARPTRAVVSLDTAVTVAILVFWHVGAVTAPRYSSIPTTWAVGAPLATAIWGGPVTGLVSGVLVGIAAILGHPALDTTSWTLPVGIVLAATGVGYLVNIVRHSLIDRDTAVATATMAERDRLARVIHDGALQVLALVEREGASLGPRGASLAREASEQGRALRALLQGGDVVRDASGQVTRRDLAAVLDRHAGEKVTVSAMADAILIDAVAAGEVDAAVTEALTNVERHAGPDARAWILLEHVGDEAIISIRDDGVGADPAVITTAGDRGRLGVEASILGRIDALGGNVRLRAARGKGVEWEFRIPVT